MCFIHYKILNNNEYIYKYIILNYMHLKYLLIFSFEKNMTILKFSYNRVYLNVDPANKIRKKDTGKSSV